VRLVIIFNFFVLSVLFYIDSCSRIDLLLTLQQIFLQTALLLVSNLAVIHLDCNSLIDLVTIITSTNAI